MITKGRVEETDYDICWEGAGWKCCGKHVEYSLEVYRGKRVWLVPKRYSDFASLGDETHVVSTVELRRDLPRIPPKSWINNFKEVVSVSATLQYKSYSLIIVEYYRIF